METKFMEWQDPWQPANDNSQNIESELKKELNEGHKLYGKRLKVKARRIDNDDVLFELSDGNYAVVHLTWSVKKEINSDWPHTEIL
ncbi:MAG: hypothetical protein GWN00_32175 [Aliifodinibius sp.]|nr:hypothetical protein [Fodinibius sp.]NIY29277.1 hypothetical protein [Fodinibius sp.]